MLDRPEVKGQQCLEQTGTNDRRLLRGVRNREVFRKGDELEEKEYILYEKEGSDPEGV